MKFEAHLLWATPLYLTTDTNLDNDKIVKYIYNEQKADPDGRVLSNDQDGWQSKLLDPNNEILKYSLSKFTAEVGRVTVFDDKSKVDAKSSAVTVPSFISELSTALGPNFAVVATPGAKLSSLTSASFIPDFTNLLSDPMR